MQTVSTVAAMRDSVRALRSGGARIALVPTMGALHDGHLALVDAARRSANAVVVSIFVNPLQFGPGEDFSTYPRNIAADSAELDKHAIAVLFAPTVEEMYPPGERTLVMAPPFAELFEGTARPGHFTGMLTVVAKLLNIVQPDVAVFGQKDLQQLALIRGMVTDLNFPVTVEAVETVREADGLAMSSRNRYLTEPQRIKATELYAALCAARAAFARGERDPREVAAVGEDILGRDAELSVDYFAAVDANTFATPADVSAGNAIVTAVRVGTTRLIDNVIV